MDNDHNVKSCETENRPCMIYRHKNQSSRPPDSLKSQLDFGVNGASQIGGEFEEESRQKYGQPVRQVGGVDRYQVNDRLGEDAQHFALRVVEHAREDLGHFLEIRLTAHTHIHIHTDTQLVTGGRL